MDSLELAAPARCYTLGARGEALAGRVRWWRVDLALAGEPDRATLARLAPAEWEEVARWRRREDRVRCAGVRAALRGLLAAECGLAPEEVPIRRGAGGKPELAEPCTGLAFNVAHSGACGLIAISRAGEVGVDVEQVRAIDVPGLAELACTGDERRWLATLAEAERRDAFFRLWVGKEAALKTVGSGIAGGLLPHIAPGDDGAVIAQGTLPFDAGRLTVVPLPVPDGYFAALALSCAP